MNLLSSASIFSFYTLISRILGYLRDILIAVFLGASVYADAFFVAFRLPNTFRRLFAEGVFNAAFIPSYTEANLKSEDESKKFADDVLNFLLIILLAIVFIAEIFTPALVYLIAPGFLTDPLKFDLAVNLTRLTFPFLFFVSLSSFFSGILNSKNKSIILVDDSLVRGTTCHKIVKMLYDAGAKEVHVRIACPEILYPDFYGVDMPTKKELLANEKTNDEMCKHINAKTLKFLSLNGLYKALGLGERNNNYPQLSDHYFTGDYPVKPTDLLGEGKITQLSLLSSKSNN